MSTATDEQTVLDVDLDAVLPCNAVRDCAEPAAWVHHCPGCHRPAQPCDVHRRAYDAWAHALQRLGVRNFCSTCETPQPFPVPWSPL